MFPTIAGFPLNQMQQIQPPTCFQSQQQILYPNGISQVNIF